MSSEARKNGDFPAEDIANAMFEGDVGKEAMDDLVKVMLFGKDSPKRKGKKKKAAEEEEDLGSRQLTEDAFNNLAAGEFVPPRFRFEVWARVPETNTRLSRCIRSFARNTVGLGWELEPVHKVGPETPEDEQKQIQQQLDWARTLFNFPNHEMPFTEVAYLSKVDEEAIGNGFWETVRNNAGVIKQLFHAPGVTMRRRVMKKADGTKQVYGYIQIRGSQKRYFKEFGDRRVMNAHTGEWYEGKTPLPPDKRATEIIHFKIYDPNSTWYGAPRYVPSSTAIAGNRQAAVRNVNFFENDAVPRMALLVSGGRLTQESMNQIEDFVRGKAKGVEQAHRCMIIQVEPTKVGFQQQNKTMVELKPLTVGVTEDASFSQYRTANDEEVREIFGMGQVFFSTDNVNKASAAVAREITNEQEFEPDRVSKEYIINETILADLILQKLFPDADPEDFKDEEKLEEMRSHIRVRFRFARLTLVDPLEQAQMDQIYATLGALTPNELRERLNKPPYPKDYFFADKPLSIAMSELTAKIAMAISRRPEEKIPADAMGPAPGAGGGAPGAAAPGAQEEEQTEEEEAPKPPKEEESEKTPKSPGVKKPKPSGKEVLNAGMEGDEIPKGVALALLQGLISDTRQLAQSQVMAEKTKVEVVVRQAALRGGNHEQ